jgi:histidinol-phosphate aminotransferase
VSALPENVPFRPPEATERLRGRVFRLRLGLNESAFGISPHARSAIHAALERVSCYADAECHDLRAEISGAMGINPEYLVFGNGIDNLLDLLTRAFLEPGRTVVLSRGAYPTFPFHAEAHGASLVCVPYSNGRNDLEALADAARRTGAHMVYVANPDNPTGTWQNAGAIQSFIDSLPDECLIVLDEAYVEFAPPGEALPTLTSDPRLVRLRTFSKAHGLAGLRIGYAVAHPAIIAALDKFRNHFAVNRLAQCAALASFRDAQFLTDVVRQVNDGKRDYYALADELNMPALPSATNFVSLDAGSPDAAHALLAKLLERDIFVRSPGAPELNQYIRVTVGTQEERNLFRDAMREIAAEGGRAQ